MKPALAGLSGMLAAAVLQAGVATAAEPPPLARAQYGLALDLLEILGAKGDRNLGISPSGIASVLAVLDLGADKTMQSAIGKTLGMAGRKSAADSVRDSMRLLQGISQKPGTPMTSADAVFVARGVDLKPGIEDKATVEGGAPVVRVDFTSREAVDTINKWASDRTNGKIPTILEPGTHADLVAVNAMAFKDRWRTPFETEATGKSPFTKIDGTTTEVEMMRLAGTSLRAAVSGRFASVELPYADARFSMSLITTTDAPATPKDFAKAESMFINELPVKPVSLTLPKFSLKQDHDLLETLAALGLSAGLGSPTQLSGFADGLRLSEFKQKIYIAIDEQGTEAAAVTAAAATRSAGGGEALNIRFDKPFLYALRHRASGVVLMAGYVADPAALQTPAAAKP